MDKADKIFYFRRFFCGRKDVYAFRVDGKGYRPRRTPKYKLTDAMIIHHMRGDVMLGAYPIFPDGGCDWVAADFDGDNGNAFEQAYQLVEALREYNIDPLCNTSQSGKGVHVRVIFGDPILKESHQRIKSWQARSFLKTFIEMCDITRVKQGGAFDRMFPAQDELPNDGHSIGNQIAMPLNREAAIKRGGSLLLDHQFKTIPLGEPTWDALELYEPLDRIDFIELAEILGKTKEFLRQTPEVLGKRGNKKRFSKRILGAGDMFSMVESCDFFQHAYNNYLSYDEWVSLAANLAPFDTQGGRRIFHSLSKHDERYDYDIADKKYSNIASSLRPTTCMRIADHWRCPHLGSDGQCEKFRTPAGRGPKSPAAVPFFLTEEAV